jgi:hypothetical protein
MAQIDWMAYAGADARGHEALRAVIRSDLGQPAELRQSESAVRELVEYQARAE